MIKIRVQAKIILVIMTGQTLVLFGPMFQEKQTQRIQQPNSCVIFKISRAAEYIVCFMKMHSF